MLQQIHKNSALFRLIPSPRVATAAMATARSLSIAGLACQARGIEEQPAPMGQFAGVTADGGGCSERQNKFGTLAMKARADCYTFCYTAARLLPRFLRYERLWLEARRLIK
jgi:hypothetical protein